MAPDPEVLVAGETLVDLLPARPGPLSEVERFDRRPGGAPANVAAALARLRSDGPPLFWTRVGDDPFGTYLEDVLAERGLPDRYVERDPGARTTLAFVTHDEAGDRTVTFYRDGTADTHMEPGRVPADALADLEWVHVGGVTLASGPSREATLDLLERAAGRGCTVSFDPNARPELWPDEGTYRTVVRDALEDVSVLKATLDELRTLGIDGETALGLARDALAETGAHTAFVTRGSEGAVAAASAEAPWAGTTDGTLASEHEGVDVDAVDATGAGDAFVAGAIVALREGRALGATLAIANAVAATATTSPGAMAALPTRDEVAALLEARSDAPTDVRRG